MLYKFKRFLHHTRFVTYSYLFILWFATYGGGKVLKELNI